MYLSGFKSVLPKHLVKQEQSLTWLAGVHANTSLKTQSPMERRDASQFQRLLERFGCSPEQIGTRGLEFAEVVFESSYDDVSSPLLSEDIGVKASAFLERSLSVMNEIYRDGLESHYPDHLLHVTCTGYVSPSAAQRFVSQHELETAITHLYHMGCYASLPAIRTAVGLCSAEKEGFKTDIVHNEICSLHLSPKLQAPENLVVQSLFADGHIRYQVSKAKPDSTNEAAFEILTVQEKLIPHSSEEMSWAPSMSGMHMTLSRKVPDLMTECLRDFLEILAEKSGTLLSDLIQESVFAVHPGGPKIIDRVVDTLELSQTQIEDSRAVLQSRGNMSSATLPHVWERLIEKRKVQSGDRVVSLAFGPGLTVFGSVFEVV